MIKQTQTKMFDFSDVDLDFCAGSKNRFPAVFKKMLSAGYNPQTANAVTILGSQITLTYGVNHGYVADRVLQVMATGGFNKEVYIDSVTSSTVTCTVPDGITAGLTGVINTKIASLGWDIVYEVGNIHVYKMKHIDDTDMYVRMCFQDAIDAARNCIAIGIGRTVDLTTGFITDSNCIDDLKNCMNVASATSNIRWDFTQSTSRLFDNFTYSQGYATFGKGVIVGSPYHLILGYHNSSDSKNSVVSGIFPFQSVYAVLDYPILFAQNNGVPDVSGDTGQLGRAIAYIGKTAVVFHNSDIHLLQRNFSNNSFLPASIDGFNTTTCLSLPVYTSVEKQYVGHCQGGVYQACYDATNCPALGYQASPAMTTDVDFTANVFTHYLRDGGNNTSTAWLVFAVEEIKHGP
ncbi:hypothetical protein QLH32_04585 [Acinetobacter corruptisaponis]|uniref:Uncharacterized protein n=1 Tax=Acinetobacter corruptisaponis TaxID=3045147 RepID=A0ABY8S6N8_9GAMM|nr:hypothetical protein [Acinetobacter sp. KCTC 92772]WHP06753.1 hypothetical protein QLH32_04585 [Acinetobacter sp. KCTC 92772]